MWDVNSGEIIKEREGGPAGYKGDLAFSPDSALLASRSKKRGVTFEVWNPNTGDDILNLNAGAYGQSVEFSPNGKLIAVTSRDGIELCDIDSGSIVRTIPVEKAFQSRLAFSPSGDRIATDAGVWYVGTGLQACQFPDDNRREGGPVFTRDGQAVVIGNQYSIGVFDPASGRKLREISRTEIGLGPSLAISSDGRRIATLGEGYGRNNDKRRKLAWLCIWDSGFAQSEVRMSRKPSGVSDVSISRDGRFVAAIGKVSDSYDSLELVPGDTRVYDARTGETLLQLDGSPQVQCIDFSADGAIAITGDHKNSAKVWNCKQRSVIRELTGHEGTVRCVAMDGKAERAATGSDDGTIIVFDLKDGKRLLTLRDLGRPVTAVAFSPDGLLIAGATTTGKTAGNRRAKQAETIVWNSATGEEQLRFSGGTSIAFGPQGNRLAIIDCDADQDETMFVSLRNVRTGDAILKLPEFDGRLTHVAWSRDGSRLVISGTQRSAKGAEHQASDRENPATRILVYEAATGEAVSRSMGGVGVCTALDISSDGRVIIFATDSQGPITYRPDQSSTSGQITRSPAPVQAAKFAGSSTFAAVVHADGAIQFDGGQPVYGNDEAAHLATWSPADDRLATASHDKKVRIWRISKSDDGTQPVLVLGPAKRRIEHLAWSKDGARIAAADGSTVYVWSTESGKLVCQFSSNAKAIAWRSDGQQIAAQSKIKSSPGEHSTSLAIFDAVTGKRVQTFSLQLHDDLTQIEWSPNGEWIAAGIGGGGTTRRSISLPRVKTVSVWNVETGAHVKWPRGRQAQEAFAWHPTENHLVTVFPMPSDQENSDAPQTQLELVVWDPETREMRRLSGSRDHRISRIVLSPDGGRIAASNVGHTIRMWDYDTGQEVLTLRKFKDWVTDVAFSSDGYQLIAGSADGSTAVFSAKPTSERE